ncbi:MAG: hypothetical protein ABR498_08795, partial [Candidatus Dormibacteria bacterium]
TYEGEQTDAIANSGCRSMASSQSDPGPSQVSSTFNVGSATILGGPVVTIKSGTLDGTSAELAARL